MDVNNKSLRQIMDVDLTDKFVKAYKEQPSLWGKESNLEDENQKNAYLKLEKLLQNQGIETYKDFVAKKIKLLNRYYKHRKECLIEPKSSQILNNKARLFNHILLNFNVDQRKIPGLNGKSPTFNKFLMSRQRAILNQALYNNQQKDIYKQNVLESRKQTFMCKKPHQVAKPFLDNGKKEFIPFAKFNPAAHKNQQKDNNKQKVIESKKLSNIYKIPRQVENSFLDNAENPAVHKNQQKDNNKKNVLESRKLSKIYQKPCKVENSFLDISKNESAVPVVFNIKYDEILNRCSDGYDALGLILAEKLRRIGKANRLQKILSENLINKILVAAMGGKLTNDSRIVL